MPPEHLNRFLGNFDPGRRGFLRRIIAGAAFAPPLIASFSLKGPALPAAEATDGAPLCSNQSTTIEYFAFSDNEYQDHFRGILRAGDITPGTDLAGGGHSSLNFKGSTGSAGSTWLTVFEGSTPLPEDACALEVEADILFHTFN